MSSASIVVAALNAFWQSVAIVACVSLALRALRRVNAATACIIWTAAFATIAVLPAVDLALQRSVVGMAPATGRIVAQRPAHRLAASPHAAFSPVRAPRPVHVSRKIAPAPAVVFRAASVEGLALGSEREPVRWSPEPVLLRFAAGTSLLASRAGPAILGAWALVALFLLIALVRDYAALRGLKRSAVPLERPALANVPRRAGDRRISLCTSDRIRIPCAAGFLRPMVLLPTALADGLPDEDLLRIVLHEIGHLQRFDDWLHATERALRAVFFFQPALWYVGSRIAFERELACDDRVLAATGEPIRYAECLTNIVERHVLRRRGFAAVPGFLLGRNQVVGRIARLVDRGRNGSVHVPRIAGLATCAALALAVGILLPLQVPLLAARSQPVGSVAHSVRPLAHVATVVTVARVRHVAHAARVLTAIACAPRHHGPCMHASGYAAVALHAAHAKVAAARPVTARSMVAATVTTGAVAAGAVIARSAAVRYRKSHTAAASVASDDADSVVASTASFESRHSDAPPPKRSNDVLTRSNDLLKRSNDLFKRSNDLLDALAAVHLHPSVDELIELHDQGVSADLLYAIADSRIAIPSVDELVATSDQGLDRPMILAAVATFGPSIPLHDIVSLRNAGVTPNYLDALVPLRQDGLSVLDTVALAQNGVTPAYIGELKDVGYSRFNAHALVQLHDSGIDAKFLRSLAQHGLRGLPLHRIIELHDSGTSS